MKISVQAAAGNLKFATKLQAEDCISMFNSYNINCEILDDKMTFLSYVFYLLLDGSSENIEAFLGFLRMKGFSVKKF